VNVAERTGGLRASRWNCGLLAKTVPGYNEPAPLIGVRRAERFGCTLVMLLWTPASASAAYVVYRTVLELLFLLRVAPYRCEGAGAARAARAWE
jgi:hypothetical protein